MAKRPDMKSSAIIKRCGDNIYEPTEAGRFRQLPSGHSYGLDENPSKKAHDLGGRFVLTSGDFSYFGSEAIPLPRGLQFDRGSRASMPLPEELVVEFNTWRRTLPRGVHNRPRRWPKGDTSWRQQE